MADRSVERRVMVISKDNQEGSRSKNKGSAPTWNEIASAALKGSRQMLEKLDSQDRIVESTLGRHGYLESAYDLSEFRFQKHHLPMMDVTISFHEGEWDAKKIAKVNESFKSLNLKPEITEGKSIKVTLKLK